MKYFDENEQANMITTTMTLRVQILKDKFRQGLGLPFKELLPESAIKQAISELKIKYKKRVFDRVVTLWAFLSQVLDTDKTCHNAVSKIVADFSGGVFLYRIFAMAFTCASNSFFSCGVIALSARDGTLLILANSCVDVQSPYYSRETLANILAFSPSLCKIGMLPLLQTF